MSEKPLILDKNRRRFIEGFLSFLATACVKPKLSSAREQQSSIQNPEQINSASKLDEPQIQKIRSFAGSEVTEQILVELEAFSPVGLISLDGDRFKCNFEIPSPQNVKLAPENGKWFVTGQAVSKNTKTILLVKDENRQITTYETTAQNAMLYLHIGKTEVVVSQVYWIDSVDGSFKIPVDDSLLSNLLINGSGISARTTIFSSIKTPRGKIDCRHIKGKIDKESKNVGQRSEFSEIVHLPRQK